MNAVQTVLCLEPRYLIAIHKRPSDYDFQCPPQIGYSSPVNAAYSVHTRRAEQLNSRPLAKQVWYWMTQLPCHYCGLEKVNVMKVGNKQFAYNGIDRKNPKSGYTTDNVVPCCKTCNIGKHLLNEKEMIGHHKRMYQYMQLVTCA